MAASGARCLFGMRRRVPERGNRMMCLKHGRFDAWFITPTLRVAGCARSKAPGRFELSADVSVSGHVRAQSYRRIVFIVVSAIACAPGLGLAQGRPPFASPRVAVADYPAVQWVPLLAEDVNHDAIGSCQAELATDQGVRLGVSDDSTLTVRLNLPVWRMGEPGASALIPVQMGEQSGSLGRYRSLGREFTHLQPRGMDLTLLLGLRLSGKTACPAPKDLACSRYVGTLDFGYRLPADEISDADEDNDYFMAHALPPQDVVLTERCRAGGRATPRSVVSHQRLLETAAGVLFHMFGGTR